MGWKPDDFKKYTLTELRLAVEGYRKEKSEYWEMVRHVSFWPVMLGNQKKFSMKDIKLPYDDIEESQKDHQPASFRKLSKEELTEKYRKSGIEISERLLERIYDRN